MEGYAFARLKKTAFSKDGSAVYLTFVIKDGSEVSFKLLYECYSARVKGREDFNAEDMAFLEGESDYASALSASLNILAYGGNTAREIYKKLRQRRFSEGSCLRVLDYLKVHGYIDEKALCKEEIDRCVRKLWGEVKIRQKLVSRGFRPSIMAAAERYLSRLDFDGACLSAARKKGFGDLSDYSERQKAYAYLTRCGFSSETVRSTLSRLSEGEYTE